MASKQTYECYVCKKNGFADVREYLDGKTIYKNPDMTPHQHKQQTDSSKLLQSSNLRTQETKEADTSNTNALLRIIIAELQRLIRLFEEQQNKDNVSNDRNLLDNR